ncbi:terminase TerL endonuclease subunit [Emticicia fontis]
MNDSIFVLIFAPDENDDMFEPATWYKGNPNLGVTIPVKDFKEDLKRPERDLSQKRGCKRHILIMNLII